MDRAAALLGQIMEDIERDIVVSNAVTDIVSAWRVSQLRCLACVCKLVLLCALCKCRHRSLKQTPAVVSKVWSCSAG